MLVDCCIYGIDDEAETGDTTVGWLLFHSYILLLLLIPCHLINEINEWDLFSVLTRRLHLEVLVSRSISKEMIKAIMLMDSNDERGAI